MKSNKFNILKKKCLVSNKELINKNLLSDKEKKWLNNYHKDVFHCLKKFMNKFELLELKKACSAV